MNLSNLDLIFEEWKANLKNKDRSAPHVPGNFEELFDTLKRAGATFDEAHVLLQQAVKAHLPAPGLARNTYRQLKGSPKIAGYSEKEFIDKWGQDIENAATAVFYSVFPRPKKKDEDDEGPKVYGNMSAKEYKVQRRFVEQFPILNTEELEKKMLSGTYNPMNDIAQLLGKKDKDGNSN